MKIKIRMHYSVSYATSFMEDSPDQVWLAYIVLKREEKD